MRFKRDVFLLDETHSKHLTQNTPGPWILEKNRLKACFPKGWKIKTKGNALCLRYHGVSHWAFGDLLVEIWGTTTNFTLYNERTKRAYSGVVLAPNITTTNSRCWNPSLRMWEMQRTCSRFIHCWAPFLAFDQKYLCSPSPFVETNENFYTGTPPLHDESLTLQEMPLSCSFFSQASWCMKGSQQTVKNIHLESKRECCESWGISLNTAELISNWLQGMSQATQSNLIWICAKPVSCVH